MINQKKLIEQLQAIAIAALDSEIWHAMYLGYGTCLGAVREKGFIEHDSDADICIAADKITPEQEENFYNNLRKKGFYNYRHKLRRRGDTGRILWSSGKMHKNGTKTCIWFQQRHKGFYWHGKGKDWVETIGMRLKPQLDQSYQCVLKGVPEHCLWPLREIKFYGNTWKVPFAIGEALDLWYPGWLIPKKGGASRAEHLLIIPEFRKPEKWSIRLRK